MFRKIYLVIVFLLLLGLSGCGLPIGGSTSAVEPTLSDAQMQTQISALLTAQPTATVEAQIMITATPELPTAEVTATVEQTEQPTPEASVTPMDPTQAPTETLEPSATVQGDAEAGGGGPGPTPPPTLTPTAGGPTATVSPDDPRNRLGTPTSIDAMDEAGDWVWPTGTSEYTSVSFANGAMVLKSTDEISGWRLANPAGREFGNLYLEATIRIGNCSANDQYGVIARVPVLKDANQGYLFGFTCDGRYSFRSWDGKVGEKGKMTRLIDWKASPAIKAGSGQTNRLGLMMVGNRMLLYANGSLLGEFSSSTYPSGYFGVFVGGIQTDGFTISVEEMAYWENPKP
jgi:hypothetical protein